MLDENPNPTEDEVRYWLAGNLCRCTGYDKIVRAVLDARNGALIDLKVLTQRRERNVSQNGHKVIGTRPIRHDGVDKVTGRAIYGADIQLTGLLHGAIKRSPHPHARIKHIDTSRAEAHPGVRAVVTAHDLPQIADKLADLGEAIVNLRDASNNVLAYGKVLYKGHAVAGVAAINLHVAQEAVELIDVEYEVLPHVTGVLEAMEDGAPILHEDMKTTSMGEETDKVSNIANHFQHKMGEPDGRFRGSRRGDRAGVHDPDRPPGLHRNP